MTGSVVGFRVKFLWLLSIAAQVYQLSGCISWLIGDLAEQSTAQKKRRPEGLLLVKVCLVMNLLN